ncbi:hypothetical protein [Ruegeria atlantica]|uniref:Uncharacterized protein n=1 Tax=Ruegeria atlantica TaxID=81569 RepID=A0A0P1E624_9RHOB|nr:hypothetical protein [Ruegeria atlantica]CUH44152.1 hypothetical protein RUM4293_03049 [Ruegeria atlantica]
MSSKRSVVCTKTRLDPTHTYIIDLYEIPLDDPEALREMLERMHANIIDMTEKAALPKRASEAAAQARKKEFDEMCAIVDARLGLPEKDALDEVAVTFNLSDRMQQRLTRYIKARRLGASPETAKWASAKGNWQQFSKVLKKLK